MFTSHQAARTRASVSLCRPQALEAHLIPPDHHLRVLPCASTATPAPHFMVSQYWSLFRAQPRPNRATGFVPAIRDSGFPSCNGSSSAAAQLQPTSWDTPKARCTVTQRYYRYINHHSGSNASSQAVPCSVLVPRPRSSPSRPGPSTTAHATSSARSLSPWQGAHPVADPRSIPCTHQGLPRVPSWPCRCCATGPPLCSSTGTVPAKLSVSQCYTARVLPSASATTHSEPGAQGPARTTKSSRNRHLPHIPL